MARVQAFSTPRRHSRCVSAHAQGCSRQQQMTSRRMAAASLSLALIAAPLRPGAAQSAGMLGSQALGKSDVVDAAARKGPYNMSEEDWKKKLTPPQYSILRQANTERPFGNPLNNEKRVGVLPACCLTPEHCKYRQISAGLCRGHNQLN